MENGGSDEDLHFAWSKLPADAPWWDSRLMLRVWMYGRSTGGTFSYRDMKWIQRVFSASPSLREYCDSYSLFAGAGIGVAYSLLELSHALFGTPFNTEPLDTQLALEPWVSLDNLLGYQDTVRLGRVAPPLTDDKVFHQLYGLFPEMGQAVQQHKAKLITEPGIAAKMTEVAEAMRGTLFAQEWLFRCLVRNIEPSVLDKLVALDGKDLSLITPRHEP